MRCVGADRVGPKVHQRWQELLVAVFADQLYAAPWIDVDTAQLISFHRGAVALGMILRSNATLYSVPSGPVQTASQRLPRPYFAVRRRLLVSHRSLTRDIPQSHQGRSGK